MSYKNVADYDISVGGPIATEHVWVGCAANVDGSQTARRACFVGRGGRTPQARDEVAITGHGGMVWWSGRIIASQAPSSRGGAAKTPTLTVEIFHAVGSSKRECKLSSKTCGPAQCKVADVRVGSATAPSSYTAGWALLVPVADA